VTKPENRHDRSYAVGRWLPLALILGLMVLVYATGVHRQVTLQNIAENLTSLRDFIDHNRVQAVLIYAGIYTLAVALSFPAASVLTVIGGLLFGWVTGAIATVFAATTGATIIFLAAKTSFEKVMTRKSGPLLTKIRKGFTDNAFSYLLFLRFVPVFPFWLVNLASALARISIKTFVLATFIGVIPLTAVYSFVGASLNGVIEVRRAAYETCLAKAGSTPCTFDLSLSDALTPKLILAIAALGLAALVPVIVKKYRGSQP
jgi:uncharacterized membrane protein YdjX (TVP38/TMEM64 family)